jgi:hypothetical protein
MNPIERAEELLSKATPGPWKVFRDKSKGETLIGTAWDHPQLKGPDSVVGHVYSVHGERVYIQDYDADLIAESPTLIRGLLDLVKQQQEEIRRLKGDTDGCYYCDDEWTGHTKEIEVTKIVKVCKHHF